MTKGPVRLEVVVSYALPRAGLPSAPDLYSGMSGGPCIFQTGSPFNVVFSTTACISGCGVALGLAAFAVR